MTRCWSTTSCNLVCLPSEPPFKMSDDEMHYDDSDEDFGELASAYFTPSPT
jgi:hypothetical protein